MLQLKSEIIKEPDDILVYNCMSLCKYKM